MSRSEPVSGARAANAIRVAFSRLRRRMREFSSSEEFTASQASVFARLAVGQSVTASDLAELEGMRPQSMAAILAALDQRGLLERAPDPTDGRRQLITLSAAGRRADRDGLDARRHWLAVRLEELDQDERLTLLRAAEILERVAAGR